MNGWQRLWAMVSIIIGLAFVGIGWINIPTEESEARRHFQTSYLLSEFRLPSKYTVEADTRAASEYEGSKDDRIYRQLGYVASLTALWAGVCIGLYGLGYACNWVYRGFKSS